MAGTSSKWTTLGSNTNSTINTDSEAEANIDVTSNGGINTQVRHECHMWLIDGADTETADFNWAVTGDFTIVLNSAKQTLDSDPGNIDVDVVGSVDGTNYVKMQDIVLWDAGTSTVGHGVYVFGTYGVMPYMRIRLDTSGTVDNSATPIKINVFNHR